MNNYKNQLENIKKLLNEIYKNIDDIDMDNKHNIKEYKLIDLENIDDIVKKCEKCGKLYIPKYYNKVYQKYCSKECLNKSTKEKRYVHNSDERYKVINNLRKLIYEKKYTAKKYNKPLSIELEKQLNSLLLDLKQVSKTRKNLNDDEFRLKIEQIYTTYKNSCILYK